MVYANTSSIVDLNTGREDGGHSPPVPTPLKKEVVAWPFLLGLLTDRPVHSNIEICPCLCVYSTLRFYVGVIIKFEGWQASNI